MVKGRNSVEQSIIEKVYDAGQGHVFRFWDELSDKEKDLLIEDLKQCDFELLEKVFQVSLRKKTKIGNVGTPEIIEIPKSPQDYKREKRAKKIGEDFIRTASLAVFTAAGGQSSRLGLNIPKGAFPVTPIKKKSLFQVHAEKIRFVQNKYNVSIPWVIMTSETNNEQTVKFFENNGFFGLNPEMVRFIIQGMNPAIDHYGKLILKEKYRLFMSPNGHGGIFSAMRKAGIYDWFDQLGIKEIFYFQVDNVMVKVCDPVFIGYHIENKCEMSSKCVYKDDPDEKIGVFLVKDGKVVVIEYIEIDQIKESMGDNAPMFTAGNIAIHMLNVDFARNENVTGLKLPFHLAHKKIPFIDEKGQRIEPEAPNGYKFETFIFDALRDVTRTIIMEVKREEEFSPLKNKSGKDSPETVLRDQLKLFARWFEDAGIPVPMEGGLPKYKLEVSPLFAAFEEDFLEKINTDIRIESDVYIE
ncbi:MAG: UDPGP type 1 family protein [Spirochaetes bacterium]|nr:MAG: UDPGP type 1 family protein [Spirochaetota bacterium]